VTDEARPAVLEEKAVRGVPWTFLSYGSTRLVSFTTALVLARLLVPKDFGLVAFAMVAIQFILHLTTLALAAGMIIRPDLDRRALGTVESMMLASGVVSALLVVGLSPLASAILGDANAAGVLMALAIPVAFGGVTTFYAALFQRELAFASHFRCVVVQSIVTAITSILLASLGAGVWSIVFGQIAGAVAYTASLVGLSPFLVRPRFEATVALDVARTGRGFVLQGTLSFAEQNMDYAIVGSLIGARPLGSYSFAYRLSELPYNALGEPIAQITFPAFARMRFRSEDFSGSFLAVLRLISVPGCAAALIVAAAADPFVHAVLGQKWLLMIGPLSILGIWGAVRPIQATIEWMLISVGHAGSVGRAYGALVVVTTPLLVLAATQGGATAVAAVMLGNVLATLAVGVFFANSKVGLAPSRVWNAVRPVVLAAVPTWLAARGIAVGFEGSAGVTLAMSVTGGLLTYTFILSLADRRLVGDVARHAARLWRPYVEASTRAGSDAP
jgi:O-antigen/teichoic acid export membrane protein